MDPNQDDPMVITAELANYSVKKTLVDQGSSVDILYLSTLDKLGIPDGAVKSYDNKLVGFPGEQVDNRGYVDLLTTFSDGKHPGLSQ